MDVASAAENTAETVDVTAEAETAIQGANPFVGLNGRQMAAALARWGSRLLRDPALLASRALALTGEELRVVAGVSTIEPDRQDKRFTDPAWSGPRWKRVKQGYLAARSAVLGTVDDLGLDQGSADRARFTLMQVTEALAPTNNLLLNPVALRKAGRTRGRSLIDGTRHFAWDMRHNGGMPSQVDTRPFEVGRTLALSAGAVIERTEQYELIQYAPTTPTVRARPLMIIPPQINRFYFLDLAPGRSFIEHAVAQGLQVFVISWRNPGPEHASWGIDTYVSACLQAIDTTCAITKSQDVNVIGFCSGGMTQSLLAGHLAAIGSEVIHANALAVTSIDAEAKSVINMFVNERTAASSIEQSRRKGMLEGRELAKVFAWVRPNDLVWNYWVSNYLLGQTPPAFDVLAWNSDATNLPATLHAEFVKMMMDNALMHPNSVTALGTPIDLSKVESDLYVVGAMTDHLVPWQAAYSATQVYGGTARFVLSNSGHIQALINPPGNPKASFLASDSYPPEANDWLHAAILQQGSWWSDWAAWTIERSGRTKKAPMRLGNSAHPVIADAPGTYVKRDRSEGGPEAAWKE